MKQPSSPTPSASASRMGQVLIGVALVVAFIGYFSGTQHGAIIEAAPEKETTHKVALAAPSYSDLAQLGPLQRQLRSRTLADQLPQSDTTEGDVILAALEQRPVALEARAKLRAFDGAPPVIPHTSVERGALACLSCHEAGMTIGSRYAPPMSHQRYDSCTQCHVPTDGPLPKASSSLAEAFPTASFLGLEASLEGERAWVGAPPTIPHPTFMRERCEACHGGLGKTGLQTSHPWRQSCEQCHAPSATLDQWPTATAGK